jgi:hypothetical protein
MSVPATKLAGSSRILCLCPDCPAEQMYPCLRGKGCSCSTTVPHHTVGKCLGSTQGGGLLRGPTAWPPWSPDLTRLKEYLYSVSPIVEDLVARLHSAVATSDDGIMLPVQVNSVRCTAVGLELRGSRFEDLL